MRQQRLKAAVVGVGIYGEVHARAYQRDPRTELVCVWSRSEERARSVGQQLGVAHTTALERIAQDEEIQIVSIATPDFAHTEPALMMLAAGKHVLVEKPMAMTAAECEQILAARDQAGTKLMVLVPSQRYEPGTSGSSSSGGVMASRASRLVSGTMGWLKLTDTDCTTSLSASGL